MRGRVLDYSSDLATLFAPTELFMEGTGYKGYSNIGVKKASLRGFISYQGNVWAAIKMTLRALEEQILARPMPWASGSAASWS